MSEGVKRRTKRTSDNQSHEGKEPKDGFNKKDQQRSLVSSLLLGILSLIWFLVKIVLGTILLLYITCVIIMYSSPAARELLIYLHPMRNPFENLSDPSSFGLSDNTVNFYISGAAGKLGAWNVPGQHVAKIQDPKADKHSHLKDGSPIFLYFHGNAYTRGTGHRTGLYKLLSSMGYHVITIDYRGYGDSEGKPSENGLIQDGMSAWRWVRSQSPEAPLYIWGHSLGSGVAGGVAKALCDEGSPPSGIILEAPFNNVWEGAVKHPISVPFRFLPYFNETVLDEVKEVFRTDKRLADVYCPILILHDRDDEIISFELGKKLYESAKISRRPDADPIKFVELNGHHGHKMIYQSEKLPGIVRDFIKAK
ncbi:Protein abhd12b [Desmophyllum pertusum]|uniref:Protein abhd12b n=1 Tax=Desmophyllum pertusum TaxID=174260 RepID=A0A9X0CII8_9CNID|nr:Protein abhd12b [Desmophyllum pertusum]